MFIGFSSDNTSTAHPRIIEAMARANSGYSKPYGEDEYCDLAEVEFRKLLGNDIEVFFALNGTGANVIGLRAMLQPWQGIICADVAHINTDESGAPEWVIGSKLLSVPSINGKISPESLDLHLSALGNFHHTSPHVLSITQSTEKGTLYTVEEIKALADKAHANGLLVHMDGTRIANAVAALNVDVRSMTRDAGVDVMSFGGAKNGLLFAEAVIFFRPGMTDGFRNLRKQSLQLVSKMRFVAVQFIEVLKDGLWLENARHANAMAALLAKKLDKIPYMEARVPEVNAVFVRMPEQYAKRLQEQYYFLELDPNAHEYRFMCSFATTEEEIDSFVNYALSLA